MVGWWWGPWAIPLIPRFQTNRERLVAGGQEGGGARPDHQASSRYTSNHPSILPSLHPSILPSLYPQFKILSCILHHTLQHPPIPPTTSPVSFLPPPLRWWRVGGCCLPPIHQHIHYTLVHLDSYCSTVHCALALLMKCYCCISFLLLYCRRSTCPQFGSPIQPSHHPTYILPLNSL